MSKSTEAVTVTSHGKEDFANVTKKELLRLGGCHAVLGWALSANQLSPPSGRQKGKSKEQWEQGEAGRA